MTRAIAACAFAYAQGGYVTVVDGIVGPWFLPLSRRERDGDDGKSGPVVRQLHQQFADLGPLEMHAIATTALDAQTVAGIIGQGLADGRFRLD